MIEITETRKELRRKVRSHRPKPDDSPYTTPPVWKRKKKRRIKNKMAKLSREKNKNENIVKELDLFGVHRYLARELRNAPRPEALLTKTFNIIKELEKIRKLENEGVCKNDEKNS